MTEHLAEAVRTHFPTADQPVVPVGEPIDVEYAAITDTIVIRMQGFGSDATGNEQPTVLSCHFPRDIAETVDTAAARDYLESEAAAEVQRWALEFDTEPARRQADLRRQYMSRRQEIGGPVRRPAGVSAVA